MSPGRDRIIDVDPAQTAALEADHALVQTATSMGEALITLEKPSVQTAFGNKMFCVENDNLSDDWGVFPTLGAAQAFVRECCVEMAKANVDENQIGLADCWAVAGKTFDEIVEQFYQENVDSIEERPYAPNELVRIVR